LTSNITIFLIVNILTMVSSFVVAVFGVLKLVSFLHKTYIPTEKDIMQVLILSIIAFVLICFRALCSIFQW
jgi:TRAP-type C4-dicarboxylate transport system permease small subunit